MVLINTCHIREKAAEKLYCDLGRIKNIKKNAKAKSRNDSCCCRLCWTS